ncbi:S53 family peptidase [Paludisphaera sp.]|uniref:S53 family peptidase n=1 Tax=Paludisphaera sp. TaxID=2017432 RepID=UPI00301DEB4F
MGKIARRRRLAPRVEGMEDRRLLSGYTPAQVRAAYGFDGVAWDGSGQTIAIVASYHNPNLLSDLEVFDRAFGLPTADVTVVNLAGDSTDATWAAESAMDVQWAHALAPGASIVLVEARSDSGDDVLAAIDVARNIPDVTVVSMSFGFAESSGQHVYDPRFTTPPGHVGVTFVAASGDHGAAGGAMYPASSPNVVGVGGTAVTLGPGGGVLSESLWSGSASGPARFAARPGYQAAFQPGARKTTPDVAFLGDPATGVAVYHTPPGASEGGWRTSGGTSLGAPAWAAIVAMVNQGRALEGKGSLDGPSQTLPALYALAGTAAFRGVTNGVSPTAAGLGVPDVEELAPALARDPAPEPSATPNGRAPTRRRTPPPRRPATFPRVVRTPPRLGPGRSLRPPVGAARVDFR